MEERKTLMEEGDTGRVTQSNAESVSMCVFTSDD